MSSLASAQNRLPMQPALVLDACVLMSGVLRALLLKLADDGWYSPVWSDKIGSEWRRNAARIWSVATPKLEQAWSDMQSTYPGANMSTPANIPENWSAPELRYSDPKDWHVILSACQAKATYPLTTVLTWNIKDFQKTELKRLGLGLLDPDRLLVQWWQQNPDHLTMRITQTIDELIAQGRRQPETVESFLKRERLFRLAKLYQSSMVQNPLHPSHDIG